MQKEKKQKDKLNAVKARLIYGEESGIKVRNREESPYSESRSRKKGGVFNRLGRKEPATSVRSDSRQRSFQAKRTEVEARRRQQKGTPSHLKLFQSAAKTEGWAMPTWCHMENYLQQTKHIKDPVEIHHIKQRDGESTEDFMERYKAEVLDVEGAPECMRISGFMHGITHPGLIKRLYERIPRSVDEMYRMTTSFPQGEVAALSHGWRKASSSLKPSEGGTNQISRKASKTN
ncbi:hypothetical protein Tco_1573873 [Tanacetum coccineum]